MLPLFRVALQFIQGCFRVYMALLIYGCVRLLWCSFNVFRFVEVLVDVSKHCKLRRISLRFETCSKR
jgi:hypothetical protein